MRNIPVRIEYQDTAGTRDQAYRRERAFSSIQAPSRAHNCRHERREEILPEVQGDDHGTSGRDCHNPRRIEPNGVSAARVRRQTDALPVSYLLAFCISAGVLKVAYCH
jgi:hypothetical protein